MRTILCDRCEKKLEETDTYTISFQPSYNYICKVINVNCKEYDEVSTGKETHDYCEECFNVIKAEINL